MIKAVVFDVGRVLLDWDPRYLFRQLLPDEASVEHFLTEICPPAWNLEQDRGRSWAEAVRLQSEQHPEHARLIEAWDLRWQETVSGPIEGTVAQMRALQTVGIPTYALTNFSAEKWRACLARFPFLASFDDAIVSGEHGVVKPEPEIYRLLLDRTGLVGPDCFFTDDMPANIAGAAAFGFHTHLFDGPEGLAASLRSHGLPSA